jgi:hypothetical protein
VEILTSKGALKKKGIDRIKVVIETRNEKSSASNLNKIFFSEMAARAEKTAEINAK